MTKPFLIDPENQIYVDGKRPLAPKLPRTASLFKLFGIIIIFSGIVFFLLHLAKGIEQENSLFQNPAEVSALITNQWTNYKHRVGTRYFLRYVYVIDTRVYYDTVRVKEENYNDFAVNDRIMINYLIEKPSVTRIIGVHGDKDSMPLKMLAFFTSLSPIFYGYEFIKRRIHNKLLQSHAILLDGTLLKTDRFKDRGTYMQEVHVEFTSPTRAKTIRNNRTYRVPLDSPEPEIGCAVVIYYHNDSVWEVL